MPKYVGQHFVYFEDISLSQAFIIYPLWPPTTEPACGVNGIAIISNGEMVWLSDTLQHPADRKVNSPRLQRRSMPCYFPCEDFTWPSLSEYDDHCIDFQEQQVMINHLQYGVQIPPILLMLMHSITWLNGPLICVGSIKDPVKPSMKSNTFLTGRSAWWS